MTRRINGSRTTRRAVLAAAAAGAGLAGSAPLGPITRVQAQATSKTFVLVHGAWHGGWCWRRVTDLLERKGHKAFAPTLTGLGERSHLMSGLINLDTHIADVVNLMRWENLENVVLVGHSYAGWVISGVVEKLLPKISTIVYLDAFMPENGQKGLDLNTERSRKDMEEAMRRNDVSRPAPPAKAFNVNDKDQAWVDSKLTAQPVGVGLQPIVMTGARDKVARKVYVRATQSPNPRFDSYFDALKSNPAWRTYGVGCGHDVMVDMPERLVEILLENA
jgi:pimeloyl-ACP methyl ester carboxylesterase